MAALLVVQLDLQLSHALFQFLDHPLASLHGRSLGLVQTDLELLNLALQGAAHLLDGLSMILFLAQLLGQAGSIGHGLLGLVLGGLQLLGLVLQVGLKDTVENTSFIQIPHCLHPTVPESNM